MHLHRFLPITLTAATLALAAAPAITQASIVINATRVIYEAASGEQTVRLTNKGKSPSLVQSWLDTGALQADRGTLDVPFIVSPPISRIDPGKSQTLRIMHSGEPLPQDRESVFWLNVLEIPPRPEDGHGTNYMQFSLRSRIKLFFRPAGLAGTAVEAPEKLTWQLATEGGRPMLQVANPTPYYVNFAVVELVTGGQTLSVQEPGMVAPFETRALALPRAATSAAGTQVRYQFINDYGGTTNGEAALQGAAR
ncbi:fimbria/pilus periplasmic chaperone [Bordetella petrii]|nr:fimbria/pilus periplasmic chaperone [Bordetella petrii]